MSTDLKALLRRVSELQPRYTPDNTPEMQERGRLLRGPVSTAIESLRPILADALGRFGDDFIVGSSDGIGRKTELPWVRFCSERMSPKPTEGFYCVIHFSTDGSAVHLTVGCGSSRFFNGYSILLPDAELKARTEWARRVVEEKFGTLAPFSDPPDFGASRPLPKSFERATAISKRISIESLKDADIESLLRAAAARLAAIYEGQEQGRDVTPADLDEADIAAIVRPPARGDSRQEYGLSAAARSAVELHAMRLAEAWLVERGYMVKDCSAKQPFDFEARHGDVVMKVEVKGTTSDRADAILMTKNEVDLHRTEQGTTALFIVSRIRLSKQDGGYVTDGGDVDALIGWDIGEWDLEPTAYRLCRPLR